MLHNQLLLDDCEDPRLRLELRKTPLQLVRSGKVEVDLARQLVKGSTIRLPADLRCLHRECTGLSISSGHRDANRLLTSSTFPASRFIRIRSNRRYATASGMRSWLTPSRGGLNFLAPVAASDVDAAAVGAVSAGVWSISIPDASELLASLDAAAVSGRLSKNELAMRDWPVFADDQLGRSLKGKYTYSPWGTPDSEPPSSRSWSTSFAMSSASSEREL